MGAIGDDRLDFYGADLGPSASVALTVAVARTVQLRPGRYLVQFLDTGANRAWVRVGPYSATVPPTATTAVPSTPFGGTGGITAFEINVRKGHNDQIAAIMAAGTGTMIVTPISRVPRV